MIIGSLPIQCQLYGRFRSWIRYFSLNPNCMAYYNFGENAWNFLVKQKWILVFFPPKKNSGSKMVSNAKTILDSLQIQSTLKDSSLRFSSMLHRQLNVTCSKYVDSHRFPRIPGDSSHLIGKLLVGVIMMGDSYMLGIPITSHNCRIIYTWNDPVEMVCFWRNCSVLNIRTFKILQLTRYWRCWRHPWSHKFLA